MNVKSRCEQRTLTFPSFLKTDQETETLLSPGWSQGQGKPTQTDGVSWACTAVPLPHNELPPKPLISWHLLISFSLSSRPNVLRWELS